MLSHHEAAIKLNLHATVGALKLLALASEADKVNINPEEWRLARGAVPWQAGERQAVVQTLEKFIFGSMDAQGMGRINACAEYIAASVFALVHPTNVNLACKWLEGAGSAEGELVGEREIVPAERIAVMVQMLYGDPGLECVPIRETFVKNMEKALKATAPRAVA